MTPPRSAEPTTEPTQSATRSEPMQPTALIAATDPADPAGDAPQARVHVSWPDLERLVEDLAASVSTHHDRILAIARGGLVPAGMLAYRLGIRDILVASVEYYDDRGIRATAPTFLAFPAAEELAGRRVLVVDEVWETGTTIAAVAERARAAGADVTTAVLHYKPARSLVAGSPDHHAVMTDAWVVYPYKAGG